MNFAHKFENTVKKTIRKYNLFNKTDKIIVACSGGKDSTTVLYILNKLGYNVHGLIIDLEIGNYSKTNLKNTRNFCQKYNIKLHEISFRKEFGYSKCKIESKLKSKQIYFNSCTICGVLRRHLLNKKARQLKFDKIVTGHNLDDEAQSILMNFFRNTMSLQSRLGPISGNIQTKKFVPRVKPLYFCLEKDIKKYSQLHNFEVLYKKCPCISNSFRDKIREILNDLPENYKIKKNVVNNFLKISPRFKTKHLQKKIPFCSKCNEPSSNPVCATCSIIERLK